MKKVALYARVSTADQEERQQKEVERKQLELLASGQALVVDASTPW